MKTEPNEQDVLMTIQNSKKPDKVIYVVRDESVGGFRTEGLGRCFGVKEIRMDFQELMQAITEFAQVLSFLLETMSTAQDLNLPYAYENEFNYQNVRYTLYPDGDYRALRRAA